MVTLSPRHLTKLTIGLILVSLLAAALPAQASSHCDQTVQYTAGDSFTFTCPGASTGQVSASDLTWGSPAIEVCDASGYCSLSCGTYAVSGDKMDVRVLILFVDGLTGNVCGGSVGELAVSFA